MHLPSHFTSQEEDAKEMQPDNQECQHSVRKVFLLNNVPRETVTQESKSKTVVGTRSIHCVRSIGVQGEIEVRNRSCFCNACMNKKEGCTNKKFVTDFISMDLQKRNKFTPQCSSKKTKASLKRKLPADFSDQDDVQDITKRRKRSKLSQRSSPKKRKLPTDKKQDTSVQDDVQDITKRRTRSKLSPRSSPKKRKLPTVKKPDTSDQDDDITKRRKRSKLTPKQRTTGDVQEEKTDDIDWLLLKRRLIHCPYEHKLQIVEEIDIDKLCVPADVNVAPGNWDLDEYGSLLADEVRLPGSVKVTCEIYGDGNCLPRCGSALAFQGDQSRHQEMRMRIVYELIKFQHLYLSDAYIAKGWPKDILPIPTCASYMQLCGEYSVESGPIHQLYNREINDLLKDGKYMGFFQIAALASVLGCCIVSISLHADQQLLRGTYIE